MDRRRARRRRSRSCALSTIGRCGTSGSAAATSNTLRGMEIVANDAVAVAGLVPATASGNGVCVRAGDAGRRRAHAMWPLWICVALLLLSLAGGAVAQVSDSDASVARPSADPEPITPIPQPPAADPQKLRLGERLISGIPACPQSNNFACSTCHDISRNGAGGHAPGMTDICSAAAIPPFDTLTVFNAALSFRLGWRGHFSQPCGTGRSIVGKPHQHAHQRPRGGQAGSTPIREMISLFRAAYGHGPDRESLLDAPRDVRTLVADTRTADSIAGSRGDASALSAEEARGLSPVQIAGMQLLPSGRQCRRQPVSTTGRFSPARHRKPEIVRVPSLRNVATTAPYFHDGSAADARAGRPQNGRSPTRPDIDRTASRDAW